MGVELTSTQNPIVPRCCHAPSRQHEPPSWLNRPEHDAVVLRQLTFHSLSRMASRGRRFPPEAFSATTSASGSTVASTANAGAAEDRPRVCLTADQIARPDRITESSRAASLRFVRLKAPCPSLCQRCRVTALAYAAACRRRCRGASAERYGTSIQQRRRAARAAGGSHQCSDHRQRLGSF